MFGIQRQHFTAQKSGKGFDGGGAARRTLVDGRSFGDRSRVGQTALVAAARALGLRQQGIDGFDVHDATFR